MKQIFVYIFLVLYINCKGDDCGCSIKTSDKDSKTYDQTTTLAFYYNILHEITKGLVQKYFENALKKAKKDMNQKPQVELVTEGITRKQSSYYFNFFINNIKVEVVKKNIPKSMTDQNQVPPDLDENGDYKTTSFGIFGYHPEYRNYESHLTDSYFADENNMQLDTSLPKEILDPMRVQRNYNIGRPEKFLYNTLKELASVHPQMLELNYYLAKYFNEVKGTTTAYTYFFNNFEYESLYMYFDGWDQEITNANSDPSSTLYVTLILKCYYAQFTKNNQQALQDCLSSLGSIKKKSKKNANVQEFIYPEFEDMSSFFKGVLNYGINLNRVLYSQLAGWFTRCGVFNQNVMNSSGSQTQKTTAKKTTTKTTTKTTVQKKTTMKGGKRKLAGKNLILGTPTTLEEGTNRLRVFLTEYLKGQEIPQENQEDDEDQNNQEKQFQELTEEEKQQKYYALIKNCLDDRGITLKDYSLDRGFSKLPAAMDTQLGDNYKYNESQLKDIGKNSKNPKDPTLSSYDNTPMYFRVTVNLKPFDSPDIDDETLQFLNQIVKSFEKTYFTIGFGFMRSFKQAYMIKINGQGILKDGTKCIEETRSQSLNKRMKKLELREICQRVVEIVNGCMNKLLNKIGQSFPHGSIRDYYSTQYCPSKSMIDGGNKFVPFLQAPPKKPPAQFVFDCFTYFQWLHEMVNSEDIKQTAIQIVNEFQNMYNDKGTLFDMEDFIQIYQILEFYCLDQDDKYYKIITPHETIKSKHIYRWSRGYIKYRRRTILVINFYIIYTGSSQVITHTSENTELCFEIEKTLSSKTETYINCYKYPNLEPPGSSGGEIPHEYYFTLYLKVLRKHYYYIKKMKLIIDNQVTIYDIYLGIFEFLKVKLGNDILQITYKKNGAIINENGFFLNFKVNTMELLDFKIDVRKEGEHQIRVSLKQGFHEIFFFFEIIYEFDQLFSDGSTIPTQDQMVEAKAAYLITLFKPFLQFFFRDILFFENQIDYNIIYNSENYEEFKLEYEPLKKYQNIDAMSYELFSMIFLYDLLQFDIELLDQRTFSSFEIMKLEENASQFFYFTAENQKSEKLISGYEDLTLDSLEIQQKSEKSQNDILNEIYEFLTKSNANQLTKPLRLIFGIPQIRRKGYIEIYGISEGFIPGALIRFYGQGFYNEHYIPFAAGYYLDFVFKQIIQEFIKDYHDMLHSFHFAEKVQMVMYNPSEVLDLLRTINFQKDFQLDMCFIENSENISIYLKKDPLYQDAFIKGDGSINKCSAAIDPKIQQKVIDIQNDFYGGQSVLNVMVTEPILQHKKQKLQLGDGIFLKQTYRANNMISQYIFQKNNMQYHKVLATKKLRSILYRFVNRRFEKLDENVEKDLHSFYGVNMDERK